MTHLAPRPPLAVVMAVLNNMPFVYAVVVGIPRHGLTDFEFVILGGGSTDRKLTQLNELMARRPTG